MELPLRRNATVLVVDHDDRLRALISGILADAEYEPLEASTFFNDGRASRPLIANTVARGQLRQDEHLYQGRINGELADTCPMPVTAEVMARGQERYKLGRLADIPADEKISFYQNGEFMDLCAGTHVRYSSKLKAFKLLSIAGAYHRGDEKNKQLQRIYGTAWETKEALEEHLHRIEEAERITVSAVQAVTEDIEHFRFNVAIARCYELVNAIAKLKAAVQDD